MKGSTLKVLSKIVADNIHPYLFFRETDDSHEKQIILFL